MVPYTPFPQGLDHALQATLESVVDPICRIVHLSDWTRGHFFEVGPWHEPPYESVEDLVLRLALDAGLKKLTDFADSDPETLAKAAVHELIWKVMSDVVAAPNWERPEVLLPPRGMASEMKQLAKGLKNLVPVDGLVQDILENWVKTHLPEQMMGQLSPDARERFDVIMRGLRPLLVDLAIQ
jgi:hypothetical protein